MSNLPKGWKETRLDEIVDITSSKRIFYSEYVDFGIAFYRSKEIIEKQKGNSISTELFITKEKYNEIKNNFGVPVKDDLLLTSVGTLGIPYLVKENEIFYFKDGNLTWFRNYKGLEPEFLYFYILSPVGKKRLNEMTIGSTQSALTISGLKKLKLELPPLDEQKQIANILSSFDKKIELLKEQNQTLETMAQTIFKEWFVDFNYPNATGEMIDSEMGEIPKGWKIFKLGEVASLFAGGDKPDNTTDIKTDLNKIPVYSNGIRNEGLYGFTDIPKILKESVTISARGTIGYVCLRTEPYVPIVRLISIIPIKQYMSNIYLYLWLKKEKISGYGSTQQQLTIPVFKERKIILPPYELMEVFSQKIDSLYNKRKHNFEQIQTLEETRDSLLPKLMSGKIRLKDFDESN